MSCTAVVASYNVERVRECLCSVLWLFNMKFAYSSEEAVNCDKEPTVIVRVIFYYFIQMTEENFIKDTLVVVECI